MTLICQTGQQFKKIHTGHYSTGIGMPFEKNVRSVRIPFFTNLENTSVSGISMTSLTMTYTPIPNPPTTKNNPTIDSTVLVSSLKFQRV